MHEQGNTDASSPDGAGKLLDTIFDALVAASALATQLLESPDPAIREYAGELQATVRGLYDKTYDQKLRISPMARVSWRLINESRLLASDLFPGSRLLPPARTADTEPLDRCGVCGDEVLRDEGACGRCGTPFDIAATTVTVGDRTGLTPGALLAAGRRFPPESLTVEVAR